MTPNIDCYWVRAVPNVNHGGLGFRLMDSLCNLAAASTSTSAAPVLVMSIATAA